MSDGNTKKLIAAVVLLLCLVLAPALAARSPLGHPDRVQRYVIEFLDPPVAAYDGRALSAPQAGGAEFMEATSPAVTGAPKLNMRSPQVRAYRDYLDAQQRAFLLEASSLLGRSVDPVHLYQAALNGMALDLDGAEAARLAKSPMVKSIKADQRHQLETDAGPEWIGAADIWNGSAGFPATRGEGIVIGIIDSGINWEHPSFADPAGDHNYTNPFGEQLGLCDMAEVECNDKLIGIYDFIEDDAGTVDVVEENTNGRDNSGHGSHVAGIAAGNPLNVTLNSSANTSLSGVAPHANLISYRVCYIGEPPEPDGGGCMGSAILAAIDQATQDGVDVINYSIGTGAFNPWASGQIPRAYLNARSSGIFVVTSAGNEGPDAESIGSPANAPWVIAAGNSSHNRIFGSIIQDLSGGDMPPPGELVGASLTGGTFGPPRSIVHARDFGYPLCGTGEDESGSSCSDNTGLSNPWDGDSPFNGKIVVCDRGTYGRIEKGKNVMLAGATGFILANTESWGESLNSDDHCIPAAHIGYEDGETLRNWLGSGSGHKGSISGFTLYEDDRFADQIAAGSSRGPGLFPVEDTLKPNMIAPGSSILSASEDTDALLWIAGGTSMASPHIAGAAALLRAVHPDWNVAQVASALETTATAATVTDSDGSIATPHERGSGRPRLGEAANASLYLDVTTAQFNAANPSSGGNPKNLNLSGLVDSDCPGVCSFRRTLTNHGGNGSWVAEAVNFSAPVTVTISPSEFTLGNGDSQAIDIDIDTGDSLSLSDWIYGEIRLRSAGAPDQVLTVAVNAGGLVINDDRDGGWKEFSFSGLQALPDATFVSGGLVKPKRTTQKLIQDPTVTDPATESSVENEDPFDGGDGVLTVWYNLPYGGLWLHAETLVSTARDLDLFVGRDHNGDDDADPGEVLCESTTPEDLEVCDLFDLEPGNYWIVVQNWDGTLANGDDVTLISAAIDAEDDSNLVISGPGMVEEGDTFTLRASWSNVNALPGQEWLGAVGIGSDRDNRNNVGVIPLYFNRTGIADPTTFPLMNGKKHALALPPNMDHGGIFIDIPPDVESLELVADGANETQRNALAFEVFRQDFVEALQSPPFAAMPGGLASMGSAQGADGVGPAMTISGPLTPGRYYVRLDNRIGDNVAASIRATATSSESSLDPHKGLWDFDRNIAQGAEWNNAGSFNFAVWYAYDEDGQPTWYIASGPAVTGNIWTGELLRVTNDGAEQQEKQVGDVSLTFLSDNEVVFSYTIFGESGFDPMHPNGPNTCPDIGGLKSYTGHWYRGVAGLGGATALVYSAAQAQVHYFFDALGIPRWIIAADDANQSATAEVIPLLQFDGFCAVCSPESVSFSTVGDVTRTFSDETTGTWTLDFELDPPLMQSINRSDDIIKLSDTLVCDM